LGYQGTEQTVFMEVFAIWYYLQQSQVKYSSITTTSNPADRVWTQNVRFFDQLIDNAGANCVDGSVFISSILMKLGIDPVIILIPGHIYMGFYGDAAHESYYLLETTRIGQIDLPNIDTIDELDYYASHGYFTEELIAYFVASCESGNCD
jgi:hypothetical protein